MKKIIYGIILFITSISITSCMSDGPYGYDTSMGEFISGNVFETDLGQKYNITSNSSQFQPALNLGERCFADFEISEKIDDKNFNVKLLSATTVEILPLITKSSFSGSSEEEFNNFFGNEPININSFFISSSYINIISQFHFINKDAVHEINLIYDDEKSSVDHLYFELRHNIIGGIEEGENEGNNLNSNTKFEINSFNIRHLLQQGEGELNITATYKWYNTDGIVSDEPVEKTIKGTINRDDFKNLKIK